MSVHTTVGTALYKTWPNVQLHMEGYPTSSYLPGDYSESPNPNLATCTIVACNSPELLRIRKLLFDRPRLQKLHLVDRKIEQYNPDDVTIKIHEDQNVTRLPALKELIIDGYHWTHRLRKDTNLWNWSDLTHLELKNVNVTNFLYKVQPHCLSGLKVFIEKYACDSMQHCHGKKTIGLYNLMMHTTALEELEIRCDTHMSDITSIIARNSSHLRTLRLRCFSLHIESWWTPLTVEQLKTIGSGCPQLMEMEVDLTLPSIPASSRCKSTTPSTTMTRSMSRLQEAKRDATVSDCEDSKDGEAGKPAAQSKIPSWYMNAYLTEIPYPGFVCMARIKGLRETAKKQGIDMAQALYEFEIWKQNHRKEEVSAFAIPASALAKFRNLRRLTIFTRMNHFVAPEPRNKTYNRTRAAVESWISELLLTKEGAGLEKVVVHVRSEKVNKKVYVDPRILESTYEYAGRRNVSGDVEIREDIGLFHVAAGERQKWY